MGSIEILGGLYIKPVMKIDRYDTEKSQIYLNVCMFRNDIKFISD